MSVQFYARASENPCPKENKNQQANLNFLSFWPFGLSFPFILVFWPFISFYVCLLGLHFLLFWPFGPSFAFIFCLPAAWGPPHKLPKIARFLNVPHKEFNSARSGCIFQFLAFSAFFNSFWPFGFHCLSFWPFGPSFPSILAFWAFISFQFGLLALHCLSFWPFGPSFSFIFCLPGLPRGVPPQVTKNGSFS